MNLLWDGPEESDLRLALAHGAGAPMDSEWMNRVAEALGQQGVRVARFEFPYMRQRRSSGSRKPPDRPPMLLDEWRRVAARLGPGWALGGKSMGGRMASMVADELEAPALVCLGYPFHPPGRPESTRVEHLATLGTPCLIVQGTRDPFGGPEEVAAYRLSPAIRVHWLEDGGHSYEVRAPSPRTEAENLAEAVREVVGFLRAAGG